MYVCAFDATMLFGLPLMTSKYWPHIDGIRAVAVLSVIAYHLNKSWLPGGYLGVDVFFVVSGFVVSASMAHQSATLPTFLATFYARRIRRIVPALVVMLLATAAASALLIPSAWLSQSNQLTGLYAIVGLSNFVLAQNAGDYFSPVSDFNPFTHTWSLGVEEQFYLLFPLIFFPWLLGRPGRFASLATLAALTIASAVVSWHLSRTDPTHAFYMIWSRFWQLGAGALLFQSLSLVKFGVIHQRAIAIAGWAGAALLAWTIFGGGGSLPSPFPASASAIVGTLLLLALANYEGRCSPVPALAAPILVFIGRISYSLYIWHWPVFVIFRWTVGLDRPEHILGATALTFAAATLSHYVVERPIRFGAPVLPRISVIALGALAIFAGGRSMIYINSELPRLSLSTVTQHASDWYPIGPSRSPKHPGCAVRVDVARIGTADSLTYSRVGCAEPVGSEPKMYVIGDSHAGHFDPVYKGYVLMTGRPVVFYRVGCGYLTLDRSAGQPSCAARHQAALRDMLPRLDDDSLVFLSSLRMPKLTEQYAPGSIEHARKSIFSDGALKEREAAEAEAQSAIADMLATGARVMLPKPTPILPAPPFRCADAYQQTNAICSPGLSVSMDVLHELRGPVVASIERLMTILPELESWDPLPYLCPGPDRCDPFAEDRPIMFDGDHLSAFGNRLVFPSFLEAMRRPSRTQDQPAADQDDL